jgi:carbamoyl-phosphate synthase large subunit
VRLIGLSYEALEPGIYLRELFAKTYQLPYPAAGSAALFERLDYIQQQEKLDIIIPSFDAELPLFSRLEPTLPQLEARDKLNLSAFGAAHNLPVPTVEVQQHAGQLPTVAQALGYPLVLKGRWYEAQIVHTLA